MNRNALSTAMLAIAVGLAAVSYHEVFTGWSGIARIFGAAILAGAVVLVCPVVGVRRQLVPVAAVLAWFLYVTYAVVPGSTSFGLPAAGTFRSIGSSLIDGWPEALDDFLPLASNPPVVVLLVTVAFVLTAVGADLIVHSNRVVPPILAPIGVLGLSLPLAAPFGGYRWWTIALAAVGIFAYLLARSNPTHDLEDSELTDFSRGRPLSAVVVRGAPVVVGAAALGVVLSGPLSFGRDTPYDPRSDRDDAIVEQPVVNPLASFQAVAAQDPPRLAFSLDFVVDEDAEIVDRVALLVLDEYDGVTWQASPRFVRTDGDLPGPRAHEDATVVAQRYAIVSLPGPWLPAAGRPVQIDAENVSFAEESAVLIGEASEYLVVSEVADRESLIAAGAGVDTGDNADRYRELPEAFGANMAELADEITASTQGTYGQLEALSDYFAVDFAYDPDARSGHSLGRLEELLTENRVGSAEQYATVYALLARSLGIPTRLVVGYDLTNAVDRNDDGRLDVTSADYDVWVEVLFADRYGWVAFDPTPVDSRFDVAPEQSPGTTVAQGQARSQGAEPTEAGPSEAPNEQVEPDTATAAWVVPALIAGFFVLWVVVFALAIVATKMRRRSSRRRAANVTQRVEGAWADARDRLIEVGVPVANTMTLTEIVQAGRDELGQDTIEPVRSMVPDISRAAYGQNPPAAETASRAWDHADNFSYTLRASQTPTRRVLARLNPKPLLVRR